jgi:prepilin-type N-terminal cleavage/methylation domain-containing protein
MLEVISVLQDYFSTLQSTWLTSDLPYSYARYEYIMRRAMAMQKLFHNQHGYTLLEMLVVILVVCILIAIIVWR